MTRSSLWKLFACLLALTPLAAAPRAVSAAPEAAAPAPIEDDDAFDLDDDFAFLAGPHGGMGMGHGGMGMGPGGGMGHGGMGMGPGGGAGPHRGMRAGRGPGGRGHAGIFADLDLSDAQRQKMRAIHERTQRTRIQSRADLQIAMLDLRQMLHAERPDKAAIDRQVDKVAQMRSSQQKAHVGALLEVRALLTPEQQEQLRESFDRPGRGPAHGRRGVDDTRDLESPKR